jgi:hypothetical protein
MSTFEHTFTKAEEGKLDILRNDTVKRYQAKVFKKQRVKIN